jgi:hypothetical protein
MKTHKSVKHTVKITDQTYCNKCGDLIPCNNLSGETPQTSLEVSFGYGCKKDGENWTFDLCLECLETITKDFKIPVEISSNRNP